MILQKIKGISNKKKKIHKLSDRNKKSRKLRQEPCMMCGNKFGNSLHHAIPKALSPVDNVLIPLCKRCHRELHESNIIPLFDNESDYLIKRKLANDNDRLKSINKNLFISNNKLLKEINALRNSR